MTAKSFDAGSSLETEYLRVQEEACYGGEPSAKTLTRKQSEKAHKKANRKLPVLLRDHGSCCYWCGNPLVLLRSLPPESIVSKTADTVTWREGEQTHKRYIATTDHVTPISKGGGCEKENLVPSCGSCNRDRTADTSAVHYCKDCGFVVEIKGRKRCVVCHEKRLAEYFGELYVPLEERRGMSK